MEPRTLGNSISTASGLDVFNSVRTLTSNSVVTLVDGFDQLVAHSSSPFTRGTVTEIQGVTGSGKTQFLANVSANHVSPREIDFEFDPGRHRIQVGGKAERVAWFDCSAATTRSSDVVSRVGALVRHHVVNAIDRYRQPRGIARPTRFEDMVDRVVADALARLDTYEPTSTFQLASTIQSLSTTVSPHSSTRRSTVQDDDDDEQVEELGCVVIDGMTEFAWTDQFERETSSNASSPPLALLSLSIQNLRQRLSPVLFISQWVLRPTTTSSSGTTITTTDLPRYRPHFTPPTWPSLTNRPRPSTEEHDFVDSDTNPLAQLYYYTSRPSTTTTTVGRRGAAAARSLAVFPIDFHVTLHPAPRPLYRRGVSLANVLQDTPRRTSDTMTTQGIVCVLRERGGRELGSWEMEISRDEIIA